MRRTSFQLNQNQGLTSQSSHCKLPPVAKEMNCQLSSELKRAQDWQEVHLYVTVRSLTVSRICTLDCIPPIRNKLSSRLTAPAYPLGMFMGSPILQVLRRGSKISMLATILSPSYPPIAYLKNQSALQLSFLSRFKNKMLLVIFSGRDSKYKLLTRRLLGQLRHGILSQYSYLEAGPRSPPLDHTFLLICKQHVCHYQYLK